MIAFLADAVLAIAFLALIAIACLIGVIAGQVENRIPYDDGRRPR